jgi:hypothetical protein
MSRVKGPTKVYLPTIPMPPPPPPPAAAAPPPPPPPPPPGPLDFAMEAEKPKLNMGLIAKASLLLKKAKPAGPTYDIWVYSASGQCEKKTIHEDPNTITLRSDQYKTEEECKKAKEVIITRELYQLRIPDLLVNPALNGARKTLSSIDTEYWDKNMGKLAKIRDKLFGSGVIDKDFDTLVKIMNDSDKLLHERLVADKSINELSDYQKKDYAKNGLLRTLEDNKKLWDEYDRKKKDALAIVESQEVPWLTFINGLTADQVLNTRDKLKPILLGPGKKDEKLKMVAQEFMEVLNLTELLGFKKNEEEVGVMVVQQQVVGASNAQMREIQTKIDDLYKLIQNTQVQQPSTVTKVGVDMEELQKALRDKDADLIERIILRVKEMFDGDSGTVQQIRSLVVRDVSEMLQSRGDRFMTEDIAANISTEISKLGKEPNITSDAAGKILDRLVSMVQESPTAFYKETSVTAKQIADELVKGEHSGIVLDKIQQDIESLKHKTGLEYSRTLNEISDLLKVKTSDAGIVALVDATILPRLSQMSKCLAAGQAIDENGQCTAVITRPSPSPSPSPKVLVNTRIRCVKRIRGERCKNFVGPHGDLKRKLCYIHC